MSTRPGNDPRNFHITPLMIDIYAIYSDPEGWWVSRCVAAWLVHVPYRDKDGHIEFGAELHASDMDPYGAQDDPTGTSNFFRFARGDESAEPFGFDGSIADWHAHQTKKSVQGEIDAAEEWRKERAKRGA